MREIIVEQKNNIQNIYLVENGVLVEKYTENEEHNRLEGNIYIRKNSKYITWNASRFYRYRNR